MGGIESGSRDSRREQEKSDQKIKKSLEGYIIGYVHDPVSIYVLFAK